ALALLAEASCGAGLLRAQDARPFLAARPEVAKALGGRLERALTAPELPDADKTMLYRVMNVNGYAAFYPERLAAYAARAEGKPAADPSRLYLDDPRLPGVRALGVAAVLPGPGGAPFARVPGAEPLARREDGGDLSLSSPRPERWSVSGAGRGPLVLAVPEDAGWRAWVDGRRVPVSSADGLFMRVPVPDGAFRAEFRYAPPGWAWLCAAGTLAWGLWLGVGLKAAAA
ncbi:MAG: YfhO family protein, partial [Elusimicrobia bacterium]|nr:YfhO family protein [Elusimicrobiota bacterium]